LRFKASLLGDDDLLLTGLRGREGISQLFAFELDLLATNDKPIDFADVLGRPAAVAMDVEKSETRFFHGIVNRVGQGARDNNFVSYRLEVVPPLWLLTRRVQSRIFQHQSVPDILKKVLAGFKVAYQIQGTFEPRDFCVQYRESDYAFASRLMEEEGIFFFFRHTADGCEMVVANTPQAHTALADPSTLIYDEVEGGERDEGRIVAWEKFQEVRSGKVTLWDHSFELPHKHLEADQKIQNEVEVGSVSHKLSLEGTDKLELYEYPGYYAQRFDGVNPGGGDQPSELEKIFKDNRRTASLRMQEEAARAVSVRGSSSCRHMMSGHKFALERHFDADGEYVLTGVSHSARISTGGYRSGGTVAFEYQNQFECIPVALPFRPARLTPKPAVRGTQTAVVVGPAGEEIFTDKYSRVKVQFHWDREGQYDADSSCWIRVATIWAGKGWGVIHIPRIGQEVVVDFLEGDPDQPIVIGSVYNADQMPPGELPKHGMVSGLLSRTTPGGGPSNFNGIRADDTKAKEHLSIQAEYDETTLVKHDRKKTVNNDESTHVKHDRTETVDNNETITVHGARTETVDKDETISVHGARTETVDKSESVSIGQSQTVSISMNQTTTIGLVHTLTVGALQAITVGAAQAISVGGSQAVTVGGGQTIGVAKDVGETIGGGFTQTVMKDHKTDVKGGRSVTVDKDDTLKVTKKLQIDAGEEVLIKTGDAQLLMKKNGDITLKGKNIVIDGSGKITVKATSDLKLKGSKIGEN
jgi:type VI secretion system secreted protein VgrG